LREGGWRSSNSRLERERRKKKKVRKRGKGSEPKTYRRRQNPGGYPGGLGEGKKERHCEDNLPPIVRGREFTEGGFGANVWGKKEGCKGKGGKGGCTWGATSV